MRMIASGNAEQRGFVPNWPDCRERGAASSATLRRPRRLETVFWYPNGDIVFFLDKLSISLTAKRAALSVEPNRRAGKIKEELFKRLAPHVQWQLQGPSRR
jgi:hypothetical protein